MGDIVKKLNSKIITFKSDYINGKLDLNEVKLSCIPSKPRYNDVDICFIDGMHVEIFDIGRKKALSTEDRILIGEEVVNRWNNYNSLLDSLIKVLQGLELSGMVGCSSWNSILPIVEKAAKKPWNEIKEFLNV